MCSLAPSARTSVLDSIAYIIDTSCNIVFLLIRLELRQHPTNLAYISSRLRGWPIVLKTSESIWRYPVFAFICYVSIHLKNSATVVRPAPEELPIRIRTTSFRGCGFCRNKEVRAFGTRENCPRFARQKVTHQSVTCVVGVDALRGDWTTTRQDLARAKQFEKAFWNVASYFFRSAKGITRLRRG
jgi:hypothetical protein